ncbi:MAG: pilus assembly protein [Planctomycetes bacterium]|nr:pilus assembly protein [Planctomycetota bacterium]
MRCRLIPQGGARRRGAAAVELALLLPILTFLLLITIDYCRLFYYSQIVTNCARNGAVYASDPFAAAESPYPDLDTAAKADASSDIQPQLHVSSTNGTDTNGTYTRVTVTYTFNTITSYPGIPSSVTITRTVQVRVAPSAPQ